MNKAQRLAACQAAMNDIDEGNPSLIIENLALKFGLAESEVEKMYWEPLKAGYAAAKRSQDRAALKG